MAFSRLRTVLFDNWRDSNKTEIPQIDKTKNIIYVYNRLFVYVMIVLLTHILKLRCWFFGLWPFRMLLLFVLSSIFKFLHETNLICMLLSLRFLLVNRLKHYFDKNINKSRTFILVDIRKDDNSVFSFFSSKWR